MIDYSLKCQIENVPREAAARQIEREEEWSAEVGLNELRTWALPTTYTPQLITLQGTVADLEKKVRLHTAQQSDYNVLNHEKCKDNAKEIADLNDVVHSQEKELKGYDEEVRFLIMLPETLIIEATTYLRFKKCGMHETRRRRRFVSSSEISTCHLAFP